MYGLGTHNIYRWYFKKKCKWLIDSNNNSMDKMAVILLG